MENFGKFMLFMLTAVLIPVAKGFVLMKLWAWFIVPYFNMPAISWSLAVGFMFIVTFLTFHLKSEPAKGKTYTEKMTSALVGTGVNCGLTLLCAYLVTLFL